METRLHYKPTVSRIIFMIFAVAILILIAIACFLPIWHVIMASISDPTELNVSKGLIVKPLKKVDFTAYKMILQYKSLWQGYRNTLMYIVLSCVITGVLTVIAGYVFSRTRFYYRNTFMLIISFTMLFNGGMIPTYMVIKGLHMLDTRWVMIIPMAVNVMSLVIIRTAIQGMPDSLEESARLDGAGNFVILFRIVIPLVKATVAVLALQYILMKWNSYFEAMIYLQTRALYPLQVILKEILTESDSSSLTYDPELAKYSDLVEYCTIVVAILPIFCFYPFILKYFTKGMMVGSLKG